MHPPSCYTLHIQINKCHIQHHISTHTHTPRANKKHSQALHSALFSIRSQSTASIRPIALGSFGEESPAALEHSVTDAQRGIAEQTAVKFSRLVLTEVSLIQISTAQNAFSMSHPQWRTAITSLQPHPHSTQETLTWRVPHSAIRGWR